MFGYHEYTSEGGGEVKILSLEVWRILREILVPPFVYRCSGFCAWAVSSPQICNMNHILYLNSWAVLRSVQVFSGGFCAE